MIETRRGLDAADEICATPGVDGVYIGPADLALSLGIPATLRDAAPEHVQAVQNVRTACDAAGIVSGIHCYNGAMARQRAAEGFRMVTVCADAGLLRLGGAIELAEARA